MGTTQITLKQCFLATGVAAMAFYAIRHGGWAGFAVVVALAIVLVELVRGLGPIASAVLGWTALAAALIAFTDWTDSELSQLVAIPLELVAVPGSWLDSVLRYSGEGVARVRSVLVFAFYGAIVAWTWLRGTLWTAGMSAVVEDVKSGVRT